MEWNVERKKVVEYQMSPSGKFIFIIKSETGLFDWDLNNRRKGEVEFIEVKTGETISRFPVCGGQKFGLNSFSYEGEFWAVTCETGKAELWNVKESQLVQDFYPIKGIEIDALTLGPDGSRLVTFESFNYESAYRVVLWDTTSGKSITELYPDLTRDNKRALTVAEFSDDNEMVAVSYNADVYLWDAKSGRQIVKFTDDTLGKLKTTHKSLTYTLKFSPDKTKIVTGSIDKLFKVWNTATGELENTFKGHKSRSASVAFSPDGKLIATASEDKRFKLWNLNTGELIWSTKLKNYTYNLKFSPDGQSLYAPTVYSGRTIFLDAKTGKVIWSEKGWWQINENWKYLLTYDKKKKQLKLFKMKE